MQKIQTKHKGTENSDKDHFYCKVKGSTCDECDDSNCLSTTLHGSSTRNSVTIRLYPGCTASNPYICQVPQVNFANNTDNASVDPNSTPVQP